MRRVLVAVMVLAALVAGAVPAYAGNWAVTELDPLPGRIEADRAYTIGYWMLQHGTHPFDGSEKQLGATGLRFNDGKGGVLEFTGSRLAEPAHYAVAVRIPAGTWRVEGIQGIFQPYEIGTLTVPGGLVPAKPAFEQSGFEVQDYWGEIKPPGFPWDLKVGGQGVVSDNPVPEETAQPAQPVRPQTAPVSEESSGVPAYLLGVVALGAGAATFVAQRLLTRRRPEPEEETAETAETEQDVLVIGGR